MYFFLGKKVSKVFALCRKINNIADAKTLHLETNKTYGGTALRERKKEQKELFERVCERAF